MMGNLAASRLVMVSGMSAAFCEERERETEKTDEYRHNRLFSDDVVTTIQTIYSSPINQESELNLDTLI